MKNQEQILEQFGKFYTENCIDIGPSMLEYFYSKKAFKDKGNEIRMEEIEFIQSLDENQFNILKKVIFRLSIDSTMMFLGKIEDSSTFKICYKEDDTFFDLCENGYPIHSDFSEYWPIKFSKYSEYTF